MRRRSIGGKENISAGWAFLRAESCGLTLILLFAGILVFVHVHEIECTEAPPTEWTQTYGGGSEDYGYCVIQTSDGGYAIAGETNAFGSWDSYLVKTYPNGTMEWDQAYGRLDAWEGAHSIVQTNDGGYALAGYYQHQFIPPTLNNYDFYLVRTNSSGHEKWHRGYGSAWPEDEIAHCVIEISQGMMRYAMVGEDEYDIWFLRVEDLGGEPGPVKHYGGAGVDNAYSLIQIKDGYLIAGYTTSYGAGNQDFWLIRTDTTGEPLWNRTYGGADNEIAYSVVQANDGGFAMAGYTGPSGGPYDFLLVKTDYYGNPEWNQTFGGTGSETARSVVQTSDGGYALAGSTNFFGSWDFWLVKTDVNGNMQWNKTMGGEDQEVAYSMVHTDDGGYAVAGYIWSESAGTSDVMLIKVASDIPDVAITEVTPCKTVVGEGYPMNINITAENQGSITENFDIDVHAGGFFAGRITDIVLEGGDSITLTFTWDTTGWQKRRYKISASTAPIPGELDTEDNSYNDGVVTITIVGDINNDKAVTIIDLFTLSKACGSTPSSPKWNANADIDNDLSVDNQDLAILSSNYGETDP